MNNNTDCFVIPHFVGAAPGSTSIRSTLSRFCNELISKFQLDIELPETYREIKDSFLSICNNVAGN